MPARLAAFAAGLLFGLGLAVSQMINPEKVLAFLDVTGDWDPSLALVMLGAVAISFLGFRVIGARTHPVYADRFHPPTRKDTDRRLVIGAAIFGVGWGLAGYCPGPAISALGVGTWEPMVFIPGLVAGSVVHALLERRLQGDHQADSDQTPAT